MTYPFTLPPDRENSTPLVDAHPNDHNTFQQAISGIYTELGANPSGAASSVQARIEAAEAATTAAQGDADAALAWLAELGVSVVAQSTAPAEAEVTLPGGIWIDTGTTGVPVKVAGATYGEWTVVGYLDTAATEASDAITAHEGATDPHPGYATDQDVTDAVAAHEAATDPHPGYTTDAEATALAATEAAAAVTAHEGATDPHAQYTTDNEASAIAAFEADAAVTDHENAVDPHPQYQDATDVQAAISAHEAAADPHAQYLTQAEADALYGGGTGGGEPDPHDHTEYLAKTGGEIAAYREALSQGLTLDASVSNVWRVTITENSSINLTGATGASAVSLTLILTMDEPLGPGYAITWDSSIDWGEAGPPALGAQGDKTVITFLTTDGGVQWLGMRAAGGFA